jgi:predicted Zn-dependent protease
MRRAVLVPLLAVALSCASPAPPPPAAPAPPRPYPEALLRTAREARAAGDPDVARAQLEQAIEEAPAWDLPRLELVEILLVEGGEGDAERAAALLAGPVREDNPRAHVLRGQVAELRGDDPGAAAAYAQALLLRADPDVRIRRALVLARLGREEEGIAELEKVRDERPSDAVARVRLAELYERGGRLAAAEAELVALARAAPGRAAPWERLAAFYDRAGEPARAREAESRARAAEGRRDRELRPLLPSRN